MASHRRCPGPVSSSIRASPSATWARSELFRIDVFLMRPAQRIALELAPLAIRAHERAHRNRIGRAGQRPERDGRLAVEEEEQRRAGPERPVPEQVQTVAE